MALWAFGYILHRYSVNKKTRAYLYLWGFAGALVYLLCSNLIPTFAISAPQLALSGANCFIMAIAMAATAAAPGYCIFPLLNGGILYGYLRLYMQLLILLVLLIKILAHMVQHWPLRELVFCL